MNNQITQASNQVAAPQINDSTALMQVISKAASDPSVDIDKLERLMLMHERMMAKDAEVQFNADMAAMQAEIPSVAERGTGHNLKYATLEDIIDVVRPIMHKYGFAISFEVSNTVHNTDSVMIVTGVLMHKAGHSIKTAMTLPADKSGSKNAVQALGSSVSYGKRYVLSALLNIATRGEDDNGYAAIPEASLSEQQAAELNRLLSLCKEETKAGFRGIYGDIENLPKSQFNKALAQLKVASARDAACKS